MSRSALTEPINCSAPPLCSVRSVWVPVLEPAKLRALASVTAMLPPETTVSVPVKSLLALLSVMVLPAASMRVLPVAVTAPLLVMAPAAVRLRLPVALMVPSVMAAFSRSVTCAPAALSAPPIRWEVPSSVMFWAAGVTAELTAVRLNSPPMFRRPLSLMASLASTLMSRLVVMLPRSRATSLLSWTSRAPLATETVPPKRFSAAPALALPSSTSLPLATVICVLPATRSTAVPLVWDRVPPASTVRLPLRVTMPKARALVSTRVRLRAVATVKAPRLLALSRTMSLLPAFRLRLPATDRLPLSYRMPPLLRFR